MKTDAQMNALRPEFDKLYNAVKAEDPVAYGKASAKIEASLNPIRDVPPTGEPRLTDPDAVLARARLTNIGYQGGSTTLTWLDQVLRARRIVAAYCGDVLDVSLCDFGSFPDRLTGYNSFAPADQKAAEALRRFRWMHQNCSNELLEYLALTGFQADSALDPEPGIVMRTPCDGPQPYPQVLVEDGTPGAGKLRKFGISDYIAEMDRRAAAGTASGLGSNPGVPR